MYWKHMNIFSTYSTQQRRGGNTGNNNVLFFVFFFCHAWASNTSVTQINNREEDDKALLYLEQLSWSHRAAAGAAGLCRSVTVDGTTSLLPSSTPLLWSPTGEPFIAYSAAEGWWGCVRVCVCHVHARKRKWERDCHFWYTVLFLCFVLNLFFWSPHVC